MPMYDRVCPNNHELIDCLEPLEAPEVICKECGKLTERAWIGKPAAVIQDSIEGGIWIRHGICNEDGSPRKYYSKTEMAAEAKRRGVVNLVEHVPERGSDKSKYTTSWTSVPLDEETRLKDWWEHEHKLAADKAAKEANN